MFLRQFSTESRHSDLRHIPNSKDIAGHDFENKLMVIISSERHKHNKFFEMVYCQHTHRGRKTGRSPRPAPNVPQKASGAGKPAN